MPTPHDAELLARFLDETIETLRLVTERGDVRPRERAALRPAIEEFGDTQPELILETYRATPDINLAAAGLLGRQLTAKVEIPSIFVQLLRSESAPDESEVVTDRARRPRTGNARRWIKRARVLVGSLVGILPAAEALAELLDLLDAALDRPAPA